MEDIAGWMAKGFWTNVGAKFLMFILDILYGGTSSGNATNDEAENDTQGPVAPGLNGQGAKMVEIVGRNTENPEEIAEILDGFEMEVSAEDDTKTKRFHNSD